MGFFDILGNVFDVFDSSTVLSTLGNVSTLASVGLEISGDLKKREAEQESASFNADQYEKNKANADLQAQDAIDRGEALVSKTRLATRQLIGRQRARIAANNIRVDSGSAVDIQLDTAQLGEMDAVNIRENASREARGYTSQAEQFSTQAAFTRNSADSSAFLTAAPTILTGAARITDNLLRAR